MEIINIEGYNMPKEWMTYPDYPEPPDDHWMDLSHDVQSMWTRYREVLKNFIDKYSKLKGFNHEILSETITKTQRSKVWESIFQNLKLVKIDLSGEGDGYDYYSLSTKIENDLKQYLK